MAKIFHVPPYTFDFCHVRLKNILRLLLFPDSNFQVPYHFIPIYVLKIPFCAKFPAILLLSEIQRFSDSTRTYLIYTPFIHYKTSISLPYGKRVFEKMPVQGYVPIIQKSPYVYNEIRINFPA